MDSKVPTGGVPGSMRHQPNGNFWCRMKRLMTPYFSIIVEPERDLVHIRMSGFFQPADVARFVAERFAAHKDLRCGPNEHVTLVDIRDMSVQSQEAVAEFQRAMHTPSVYSRRIAFVTKTSLSRSQIRRASDGRKNLAYFGDIGGAEAWLFSVDAQAAA